MFPIATTASMGQLVTAGPLDVHKPPPSPAPVPLPLPNMCTCGDIRGASTTVKAGDKPVVYKGNKAEPSKLDEAGAAGGGGLKSARFIGPCEIVQTSSKVKVQNKSACMMPSPAKMNNENTVGMVTPSQTSVFCMG